MSQSALGVYKKFGKRTVDIFLSLVLLIILSPIIFVVAAVIRLNIGSPVLFRQTRPGLNGKPFDVMKFRTMNSSVDSTGEPLPDEERLTRLGAILRKLSLDELPQLANVLKGQMSLVGPRPLLMQYLPLYSERQFRRHEVKPGITGWAQVSGRNAISWQQRFELDVWYVDHQSIGLDLKILFLTVIKTIHSSDVSHEGHVTMPFFTGRDS